MAGQQKVKIGLEADDTPMEQAFENLKRQNRQLQQEMRNLSRQSRVGSEQAKQGIDLQTEAYQRLEGSIKQIGATMLSALAPAALISVLREAVQHSQQLAANMQEVGVAMMGIAADRGDLMPGTRARQESAISYIQQRSHLGTDQILAGINVAQKALRTDQDAAYRLAELSMAQPAISAMTQGGRGAVIQAAGKALELGGDYSDPAIIQATASSRALLTSMGGDVGRFESMQRGIQQLVSAGGSVGEGQKLAFSASMAKIRNEMIDALIMSITQRDKPLVLRGRSVDESIQLLMSDEISPQEAVDFGIIPESYRPRLGQLRRQYAMAETALQGDLYAANQVVVTEYGDTITAEQARIDAERIGESVGAQAIPRMTARQQMANIYRQRIGQGLQDLPFWMSPVYRGLFDAYPGAADFLARGYANFQAGVDDMLSPIAGGAIGAVQSGYSAVQQTVQEIRVSIEANAEDEVYIEPSEGVL